MKKKMEYWERWTIDWKYGWCHSRMWWSWSWVHYRFYHICHINLYSWKCKWHLLFSCAKIFVQCKWDTQLQLVCICHQMSQWCNNWMKRTNCNLHNILFMLVVWKQSWEMVPSCNKLANRKREKKRHRWTIT